MQIHILIITVYLNSQSDITLFKKSIFCPKTHLHDKVTLSKNKQLKMYTNNYKCKQINETVNKQLN